MPVYEYECSVHGVFDVFHKGIPDKVPREEACPENARRAAPEGSRMAKCYMTSPLRPSLGIYGDVKLKAIGRLSRERRRYHQKAPEREAEERKHRPGMRRGKPITREDVDRYRERKAQGS